MIAEISFEESSFVVYDVEVQSVFVEVLIQKLSIFFHVKIWILFGSFVRQEVENRFFNLASHNLLVSIFNLSPSVICSVFIDTSFSYSVSLNVDETKLLHYQNPLAQNRKTFSFQSCKLWFKFLVFSDVASNLLQVLTRDLFDVNPPKIRNESSGVRGFFHHLTPILTFIKQDHAAVHDTVTKRVRLLHLGDYFNICWFKLVQ